MIDDAQPQTPQQSPEPVPIPAPRIVSDDELLGAETELPEPLLKFRAVRGSDRYRKATRVALIVAAIAAVGFASGATTHGADVHRADDSAQHRMLLRLVGGSTVLSVPNGVGPDRGGTGPTSTSPSGPATVQVEVGVRNDGARTATITSMDLAQPGVKAVKPAAVTVIKPGEAAAVGVTVLVDCGAADLTSQPKSVTLHVQDADAKPSTVTLPLSAGATASGQAPGQDPMQARGFFQLCGDAELNNDPTSASYVGATSTATAADPAFAFKITVRNYGSRPKALTPTQTNLVFPGMTMTTDLASSVPLASGTTVDADITLRITDCAQISRVLKLENGINSYLSIVGQELPIGVQSGDPRFQATTWTRPLSVYGNVSDFDHDLLVNLASACPALK